MNSDANGKAEVMRINRWSPRMWYMVAIIIGFCSAASAGPKAYLKKPDAWFAVDEAKHIAANILSWQSELGGWPKNVETADQPYTGKREDLKPTYDNSAT